MVRLILLLLILTAVGAGNEMRDCYRFGDVLKPVAAPEITITAQFASDMAGDFSIHDLNLSDFNLSAWDAKVLKKWQDAVNKTRLGDLDKGLYEEF